MDSAIGSSFRVLCWLSAVQLPLKNLLVLSAEQEEGASGM